MNRSLLLSTPLVGLCSLSAMLSSAAPASAAQPHRHPAAMKLVHPGYLTVGSDTTYPPMESRDAHNHFVGADIDLAKALAHAMGLKGAIIVSQPFDTIIPAMTTRRAFDVIMSSMNDTPARRKIINFVDYMRASEGIVVKASSNIHANSYAGMCGRTVSVERGTTEESGLMAANTHCKPKINIKSFTADSDAYQAFASGHSDAYTGDLPVAALYVKTHQGALRLAGKPFGAGQDYGIGVPKNNPALKSALTRALHKVKSGGLYRRILQHWGVGGASL